MNRPTVVVGKRLIYDIRVIVCLIALAMGLIALVSYELGLNQAGYNRIRNVQTQSELRRNNTRLVAENKILNERLAILDTGKTVDQEAYRHVELQLAELQNLILDQQENLEFYRGIVDEDGKGLRIQAFQMGNGRRDDEYELRLVLAQALRSKTEVAGKINLTIQGQRDGEAAQLHLGQISSSDLKQLSYSFRYYQDLKFSVRLPEDFLPERVHIVVRPSGKSAKTVEEFFVWQLESS